MGVWKEAQLLGLQHLVFCEAEALPQHSAEPSGKSAIHSSGTVPPAQMQQRLAFEHRNACEHGVVRAGDVLVC